MYDDVLVPTDGSKFMERTSAEAVTLARLSDARVHALHAIDETTYGSIPEDARETVRTRLLEDGKDATRTVAERAFEAGLEVTREIRWGPPAHVIVSYALENDIDLIVMGTHGRTGYERYLLGSVAERVVRSAPMPVMTIDVEGETDAAEAILENVPSRDRSEPTLEE
ncbi:universal stress protein [Natrialbaceae archaeon A-gly3]